MRRLRAFEGEDGVPSPGVYGGEIVSEAWLHEDLKSIRPLALAVGKMLDEEGGGVGRALAALADGGELEMLRKPAEEVLMRTHHVLAAAVNRKDSEVREYQKAVMTHPGYVEAVMQLSRAGLVASLPLLQILLFRQGPFALKLAKGGMVDVCTGHLARADTSVELRDAALYALNGMAAFNNETHKIMLDSPVLLPALVSLVNSEVESVACSYKDGCMTDVRGRAAAVIRNLSHSVAAVDQLREAGALDAMVDLMHNTEEPAGRINASVAVACMAGGEEDNPALMLSDDNIRDLVEVCEKAMHGEMYAGSYWTVWKLMQGLASLTINEANVDRLAEAGCIRVFSEAIQMPHHHQDDKCRRFMARTFWNLAFSEKHREVIAADEGVILALRDLVHSSESKRTREVAKGALWVIGLQEDVDELHEGGRFSLEGDDASKMSQRHIMLSYNWAHQNIVAELKTELEKAGYKTWMDIDKMQGSTLEAMANAVEESDAIILCVSKGYKESQACRTEAEYAFQMQKKLIPVLVEKDYRPSGWLGALMGSKLYFNATSIKRAPEAASAVMRELGSLGKVGGDKNIQLPSVYNTREDDVDMWSIEKTQEFLKKNGFSSDTMQRFSSQSVDGACLLALHRTNTRDPRYFDEIATSHLGLEALNMRLRFATLLDEVCKDA